MVDRYTNIVLTLIACALVALVARPLWEPRVSHAGALKAAEESGVDLAAPPRPQVIPRSWGKLVAASAGPNLHFEDADGTIRSRRIHLQVAYERK
jgi:hypothetical protein